MRKFFIGERVRIIEPKDEDEPPYFTSGMKKLIGKVQIVKDYRIFSGNNVVILDCTDAMFLEKWLVSAKTPKLKEFLDV